MLIIPAGMTRYSDAQLDDYGGRQRRHYPWTPGTKLSLKARFAPERASFAGTAGFGFWNAPFGDPTTPWPALPRAAWFFYGSPPNDFPVAPAGPGRGWFAGTIDATTSRALALIPLGLPTLLLNRSRRFRDRYWPRIQRRLGISFQPLEVDWLSWATYQLVWARDGCSFWVNGRLVLQTPNSPKGPMGFVCWVDNQYLALSPTGRFRAGILPTKEQQTLEISGLSIVKIGH